MSIILANDQVIITTTITGNESEEVTQRIKAILHLIQCKNPEIDCHEDVYYAIEMIKDMIAADQVKREVPKNQ